MSPAARVAGVLLTVLLYVLPRTSVADKVKFEVDNKVLRAEKLLAEVKGSASDAEKAEKRRDALKLFTASLELIEKYGDPERPTIRLHAGTLALLLGENELARTYCSRAMDQFGPASTLDKVAERCMRDAAQPPAALASCPPPPVCPPLPDPVSYPPLVCPPASAPSQTGPSLRCR